MIGTTITLGPTESFELYGRTIRSLHSANGCWDDDSFISCYSTSRKDVRGYVASIRPASLATLMNIITARR